MVLHCETLKAMSALYDLSVAIEHQAMAVSSDASTPSDFALAQLMTEALESVTAAYEIYAHINGTFPKFD